MRNRLRSDPQEDMSWPTTSAYTMGSISGENTKRGMMTGPNRMAPSHLRHVSACASRMVSPTVMLVQVSMCAEISVGPADFGGWQLTVRRTVYDSTAAGLCSPF